MNTNFTIKNFRVFDENGVSLELKPITILTGCNSSGKSSIARAMLLLNSFLSQIRKAIENDEPIELSKYKIDFTTYPNNQLGRYDKIVHDGSNQHSITFAYTTYSLMLSKEVDVELVFDSNKNDELNNAYLQSITIKVDEEVFYSSDKKRNIICNLNCIKDKCCDFVEIEFLAHNYCGLEGAYDLEYKVSKNEYEEQKSIILSALEEFEEQRTSDVYKYIRMTNQKNSIVNRCDSNLEIVEWAKDNGSIFMVPIIKWLDTLSKDSFSSVIEEKFLNNASKSMVICAKWVIDDFISSEFTTFSDYFKDCEEKYLKNPKGIGILRISKPGIPKTHDLDFNRAGVCYLKGLDEELPIDISDLLYDSNKESKMPYQPSLFKAISNLLMYWDENLNSNNNNFYCKKTSVTEPTLYHHKMHSILNTFAIDLVREVLCPDLGGNMEYVSSSRVDVKRLYTLEGNDDFSQLLKKYFEKKRVFLDYQERVNTTDKHNYELGSFTNKWIQKFGIGYSLLLSIDSEGLGAQIQLRKEADSNSRLLADEGYGITQLVSILLQIETAILSAKGVKVNRYWGLSHLDHYDDSKFHYEINTIVVEEPEIHLHPNYQSLLADMLLDAYTLYNIRFIIETHSEYMLRHIQVIVARMFKNGCIEVPFNVIYVNGKGSLPLYDMGFQRNGRFVREFGDGFYNVADDSAMELFDLENEEL